MIQSLVRQSAKIICIDASSTFREYVCRITLDAIEEEG